MFEKGAEQSSVQNGMGQSRAHQALLAGTGEEITDLNMKENVTFIFISLGMLCCSMQLQRRPFP